MTIIPRAQKRKTAIVAAKQGQLGLLKAIKNGAVDIWVKDHKKFIAAAAAVLADALTLGLLHGRAQDIATLVVTALGAAGVHQLPNVKPTDAEVTQAVHNANPLED